MESRNIPVDLHRRVTTVKGEGFFLFKRMQVLLKLNVKRNNITAELTLSDTYSFMLPLHTLCYFRRDL